MQKRRRPCRNVHRAQIAAGLFQDLIADGEQSNQRLTLARLYFYELDGGWPTGAEEAASTELFPEIIAELGKIQHDAFAWLQRCKRVHELLIHPDAGIVPMVISRVHDFDGLPITKHLDRQRVGRVKFEGIWVRRLRTIEVGLIAPDQNDRQCGSRADRGEVPHASIVRDGMTCDTARSTCP